MNSEAIHGALFDPTSELDLIQLMFPQLETGERLVFLKLRAVTLLLTRGVNADFSNMDASTRIRHERFIQEREARWVELQWQVRSSGLLDGLTPSQKSIFENDFSKVRFTAS